MAHGLIEREMEHVGDNRVRRRAVHLALGLAIGGLFLALGGASSVQCLWLREDPVLASSISCRAGNLDVWGRPYIHPRPRQPLVRVAGVGLPVFAGPAPYSMGPNGVDEVGLGDDVVVYHTYDWRVVVCDSLCVAAILVYAASAFPIAVALFSSRRLSSLPLIVLAGFPAAVAAALTWWLLIASDVRRVLATAPVGGARIPLFAIPASLFCFELLAMIAARTWPVQWRGAPEPRCR